MGSSLYYVMDKRGDDVNKKEEIIEKPVLMGRWNWYGENGEEHKNEIKVEYNLQRYNWWIE